MALIPHEGAGTEWKGQNENRYKCNDNQMYSHDIKLDVDVDSSYLTQESTTLL